MSQQETIQLSQENIIQCLKYLYNPPNNDEKIRKQADKYLIQCEQNPEYPLFLLEIFQQANEEQLKIMTFICLKNLIQRYWSAQRRGSNLSIREDIKLTIRNQLLIYLVQYQNKQFQKQINHCLSFIVKNDFPNKIFQELYDYIFMNLQKISQCLQQQNFQILLETTTNNFLATLKTILKEQQKKRISMNKEQVAKNNEIILNHVIVMWESINQNLNQFLQGTPQQIQGLLNLSTYMDKILINSILCTNKEANLDQYVSTIILKLLQKAANFQQLKLEYLDEINKQLKVIINGMADFIIQFPLSFISSFQDLNQLLFMVLQNCNNESDHRVIKSAIVCLYKILKSYTCYADSSQYIMTISKSKQEILMPIQQSIKEQFMKFYQPDIIEKYFQFIIFNVIPLHQTSEKTEEMIEHEDESYIDDCENETENSMYNLSLHLIQSFMQRFPKISLQLLQVICGNLVQSKFQTMDLKYQDGIFAIMGLIPSVAEKNNIHPNDIVNIYSVLEYMYSKSDFFSGRITILIQRWLKILSPEAQLSVCQIIIQIIVKTQNPATKYQGLMCLKQIIKIGVNIDFQVLINQIAPIIVCLFSDIQQSELVWQLVYLLQQILQKAQFQNNLQLAQIFQNNAMIQLLNTNSEFLKQALVDMLKSLVVFFPQKSPIQQIFQLCMIFINLQVQKDQMDQSILDLWYLVVKEYDSSSHALDNEILQIYSSLINFLISEQEDFQLLSKGIYIAEEYMLLNIANNLNLQEFSNLIYSKYQLSEVAHQQLRIQMRQQQDKDNNYDDSCIELKIACLNWTGTALLMCHNSNQLDNIVYLENLLKSIIKDLMNEVQEIQGNFLQQIPVFRTLLHSLTNRCLLQNPQGLFQYIRSLNISDDQFFQAWMLNMENLFSKNSQKLNTVTVLKCLQYISPQVLIPNFGYLLQKIMPDIDLFIDQLRIDKTQANKKVISQENARLSILTQSFRKRELRKTQLFDQLNMKQFFIETVNNICQQFNINESMIRSMLDKEGQFEKLQYLMQ